jgi:hypothetical protein
MKGYLIYHPKRCISSFNGITVYYDATIGNQDPYLWNTNFLHTYCHITQMSPEPGHINFWVSGDAFPNFSHLYCDLVFVVERKVYWNESNTIDRNDPLVDSGEAYTDHYQWAFQHKFKRRRRFTLKADQHQSFQPQNADKSLIDILPLMLDAGHSKDVLRDSLRAGYNSKPFLLGDIASVLYEWLSSNASIKLTGEVLEVIRRNNVQLASPSRREYLLNSTRLRKASA